MLPSSPSALSRRQWLGLAGLSIAALATRGVAAPAKPKKILLCSGWQWVSIGDISQTPGGLRLLEQHLPDAQVTLWFTHPNEETLAFVRKAFPKLRIVEGSIDKKTLAVTGEPLQQALAEADLVVHGSAPTLLAPELLEWCQTNKKPFGVLGITLGDIDEKQAVILSNARFAFARESSTLAAMKKMGVKGPKLGLIPDSAFSFDLRDDAAAGAFLKANGLEEGKFFCAIPRLRYTPYRRFPPDVLRKRAEVNDQFAEVDHAKLRDAITLAVRKTGMKVLVCPEMTYQVALLDKLLIDPLPDDVKKQVVKRGTFWMPDEAASIYARAAAVISFEMHSPILALAAGTPIVYLHQPTEIHKGQVFRDLGLQQWVQEIEDSSGERIAKVLIDMLTNSRAAKAKVAKALEMVMQEDQEALGTVAAILSGKEE